MAATIARMDGAPPCDAGSCIALKPRQSTKAENTMSNGSDPNPYTERNARVSQPRGADDYTVVLVDEPAPHVRRITMNRPEKRNALNHALRGQLLHALQAGDMDESVR